jgi:hypothetical protein
MNEHQINVIHDSWLTFRFVRQSSSPWPHAYRPTARGGPFGTIVVAYSVLNRGGIGRFWYVMATPGVVDGLQIDPATVADPHNGLPVVPRTVHSNQVPMPYHYCPDEALEAERQKRAAHVAYFELQRKLQAVAKPQPPGLLARLLGAK